MQWTRFYQILLEAPYLLDYMQDGLWSDLKTIWHKRQHDKQLQVYAARGCEWITFKPLNKLDLEAQNSDTTQYHFRYHHNLSPRNRSSISLPDYTTIQDFWAELDKQPVFQLDTIVKQISRPRNLDDKEAFDIYKVPSGISRLHDLESIKDNSISIDWNLLEDEPPEPPPADLDYLL